MLLRLFLLFTLVPVAELALLIRIGGWIGLGPTLALVIGTGAAGAWLARREGLRSWLAVQGELAEGRIPTEELVHGLLILVAGIVLLTPGVLTDAAGLLLLVRPVRKGLIGRLRKTFSRQIERGTVTVMTGGGPLGGFGGIDLGGGPFPGSEARADGDRSASGSRPAGREILVDEEPVER